MNKITQNVLLISILILNAIDCILTLYWVGTKQAVELNPLMNSLIHNPILFCLIKIGMVSAGVYLLYKYAEYKITQVSLILLNVIYVGIVCYHVWYVL